MLDKQKTIDFLVDEITSCQIVGDASDQSIVWELNRVIKRINAGLLDVETRKVIKTNTSSQACPVCKSSVNDKYCSSCGQKLSY